ncbi:MAG: MarR family transcriptional regulator [Microbacteriaceae bacterium]|mgnify:CR=1 FL=1|jgi:DNA-binding MarR family transcriptional regulator|nr:MarR family transcriptional regulator [Microbacteriaceae bacterium]HPZ34573.1 MarR family transcriptional regulator [Microbacteriaceae bacterium]HQC93270.1 MarR family transcriptional regulator [Microbacteriaceae bacterium]
MRSDTVGGGGEAAPDAHEQAPTAGRPRVDDQLCFALYAASRAVTAAYRARLAPLGVTYPQYLALLAIWEAPGSTVSELGRALALDSGTLSPLLRRLEREGLVRKERAAARGTDGADGADERTVRVYPTAAGDALEPALAAVRAAVEASTGLSEAEFLALRRSLHTLRATIEGASS